VVITGLTRNQFAGNRTWVRIPPSPPKTKGKKDLLAQTPVIASLSRALTTKSEGSFFVDLLGLWLHTDEAQTRKRKTVISGGIFFVYPQRNRASTSTIN
jgi:hypothetical protein